MIAASRSACWSTLARRSARSTLPASSQATTTTRMPAMTALAAFVPCAELGIRQTSRLLVAAGAVVAADRQQAGELALRAGVGLHAHRGVAGDLGQPGAQLVDQLRRSRGPARPGRRGAGPANSGQVIAAISVAALSFIVHEPSGIIVRSSARSLSDERAQVAQHRRLRAVRGEDRVGQVRRAAAQVGRQRVAAVVVQRGVVDRRPRRHSATARRIVRRGGLVAGDRDRVGVDQAQVDPALAPPRRPPRRPGRARRRVRVSKKCSCTRSQAAGAQPAGQRVGAAVHPRRDRGQALGPVVDGVGAGHDGEQHLGGADVAGRLLAADVLLAGLQRQPVGDVAVGVDRDADQAAGQLAGQPLADGQVAGVRAAVAHRDAEALGGAAGDVGAPLPRRLQQREREQVGGDDDRRPGLVRGGGQRAVVADGAAGARVGQQHAEGAGLGQVGGPALRQVGDVQA